MLSARFGHARRIVAPVQVPSHLPSNVRSNLPSNVPSNLRSDLPSNLPLNLPSNVRSSVSVGRVCAVQCQDLESLKAHSESHFVDGQMWGPPNLQKRSDDSKMLRYPTSARCHTYTYTCTYYSSSTCTCPQARTHIYSVRSRAC